VGLGTQRYAVDDGGARLCPLDVTFDAERAGSRASSPARSFRSRARATSKARPGAPKLELCW
jgi:hypothetical protein